MYDVIVVGVGSMGSAACYFLAKAGAKVLGIEQYGIVHQRGSHSGHTRIIRKAYFEHPAYVPLLQRAYHNWKELENILNEKIYYRTGLLYIGMEQGPLIKGLRHSSKTYHIPLIEITTREREIRYPIFVIPEGHKALLEEDAGFLVADRAIRAYTNEAVKLGAKILTSQKISGWCQVGNDYEVSVGNESFKSKKLVFTAGAWTSDLLESNKLPLHATLQTLHWAEGKNHQAFHLDQFPCWVVETPEQQGVYYGFPIWEDSNLAMPKGLKIAHHHPAIIARVEDELSPDQIRRAESSILEFSNRYFSNQNLQILSTKTCYYNNTPDGHFIIDFLPGHDHNVSVACGFSGHGFKFVSAVGELLADMIVNQGQMMDKELADLVGMGRFQKFLK